MHRLAPLAVALSLAFPAAAQVRFQVTPIGTLGGATSRAYAIADDGTVVGQSTLSSGVGHAFSFRDGVLVDLDPDAPPFVSSVAYAVREQGLAAGGRGADAALFAARRVTLLGNLGGSSTYATGIDAAGRVVGRGLDADGWTRGFRQRNDGSLEMLPELFGSAGGEAVTPGGTAYGWAVVGLFAMVPARWNQGEVEILELPTRYDYIGQALAVNANGVAVGRRDAGEGDRAAVWIRPQQVLEIPGDYSSGGGYSYTSVARGVNDAVQVVGQADLRFTDAADPLLLEGWIWAGGARHALNDLLHGDPGVTIVDATGINRWGQIAANASDGRARLLTPTGSLTWRGADGDRFGDPAAWDSGGLGFAPNRFLSARLEAATPTRVRLPGQHEAQVITLGQSSAPATVRLVLEDGALLKLERLDIGGGGVLGGDGRVQGDLRLGGRIEARDDERLVLEGSLQHVGAIVAHDRSLIVYQGEVEAGAGFETHGTARHRFEARFQIADGAGVLAMGNTEFAGPLLMRLGGLVPGREHDQLSFSGGLVFTPGAVLDLRWSDGFVAAEGDRFQLFLLTGAIDGRPGALHLPALPRGLAWRTDALFESGLLGVTAVPEPGTAALWLAGLLVLARRRLRTR